MKQTYTVKLLTHLVFFLSVTALTAQNVYIPDANFKAALVGNSAINTNGDTAIQVSEAQAFSGQINVSSLGITTLTGIEAFTALTELNCSDNQLTILDVSKDRALTALYCYNNNLTSLNVSGLLYLDYLDCENNSLTSLDVNQNTALTTLFCNNNSLTSLNISQDTALFELDCDNNSLMSLDVSAIAALSGYLNCYSNPSLYCIQVDDTTYANTHFTEKDPWAHYSTNCNGTITGFRTSIEEADLQIYPNPATDFITIMTPEIILSKEIVGLDGLVVLQEATNEKTLNVSAVPKDIYFLRLQTDRGVSQHTFVKQ